MTDQWLEDLEPEEEEKLIDSFCKSVGKRQLETPAILALESHKPIARLAGQGGVVFAPFLAPFLGHDLVRDFSRLLRSPQSYERLIQRLDSQRQEPQEDPS